MLLVFIYNLSLGMSFNVAFESLTFVIIVLIVLLFSCFIFQIGHVTKSGDIAGPRVLEHIVDVVLYMEVGTLLHFYL